MILLFDIGNTHTHIGLANDRRVLKQINFPTREWLVESERLVKKFAGAKKSTGAALCSVVPQRDAACPQNSSRTLEIGRAGTHAENFARRGH
jgi:pantothenate kinase type III